ncbi:MAG: ArsR/SmtB family transcription factor [Streptomycetales bacterium]
MGERSAKDAMYDGFAVAARALASGRRAEIVDVLSQGERSVEDLAGEIEQGVSNTSQHLHHLARAGLVRHRRDGNRVVYRLASGRVGETWRALRDLGVSHLAELDRRTRDYLGERDASDTLSRAELATRMRAGEVVVLDVRPRAEYAAGHIPGARPVPLPELRDRLRGRLDDVPAGVEIVAYCRGPYCAYADEAVRLLRSRGIRARRLDDGLPEWMQAGYPVAIGP